MPKVSEIDEDKLKTTAIKEDEGSRKRLDKGKEIKEIEGISAGKSELEQNKVKSETIEEEKIEPLAEVQKAESKESNDSQEGKRAADRTTVQTGYNEESSINKVAPESMDKQTYSLPLIALQKDKGKSLNKKKQASTGLKALKDHKRNGRIARISKKRDYEKEKLYGEKLMEDFTSRICPFEEQNKTIGIKQIPEKEQIQKHETIKTLNNSVELTLEFGFRETDVQSDHYELLLKFIQQVREMELQKIIIEGHACAHGGKKENLIISKKRALSVKGFLLKQDVKGDIILKYFGEDRLKFKEVLSSENINDSCVKANRRV